MFYEKRSKSYAGEKQRNMRLVWIEAGARELYLYRNEWFQLMEEVDF